MLINIKLSEVEDNPKDKNSLGGDQNLPCRSMSSLIDKFHVIKCSN